MKTDGLKSLKWTGFCFKNLNSGKKLKSSITDQKIYKIICIL